MENHPQPEDHQWRVHEDHVAALYRLLGYTVEHNVSAGGQQVDLICEKWIEGLGITRLYIDCKHTRHNINSSVSKDDVASFIYAFRANAEPQSWTGGVMVSNRPFSQYAKALAKGHANLHLKTIEELHEEILHIRAYLHECVRRYDSDGRFTDYIPPYASVSDMPSPSDDRALLSMVVHEWIEEGAHPQLCLFGDFGTGKTTFLEHLQYSLAKRYLTNASSRIPLLIGLRRYYDAVDHLDLIKQFFSIECSTPLQYPLFEEFLKRGRFVLLLDGFDEMGARSDPAVRKLNYLKIAPLLEQGSRVLISCRPAYFISLEETKSLFSFFSRQLGFSPLVRAPAVSEQIFKVVQETSLKPLYKKTRDALRDTAYAHLHLFNWKQIRAYVRKHDLDIRETSGGELDSSVLLKRIQEIYDLEDLATRPILLKLIVTTVPLFRKSESGGYVVEINNSRVRIADITPAVLYSVYTEKELEREYLKGRVRWLIDRKLKLSIIAAIAYEMFKSDTLAIDRHALRNIVRQHCNLDEDEEAFYLTDIRTCSFLSRDTQDAIRFTHKSFMEYFAATHLRALIEGRDNLQDVLSAKLLTDEIAYFLGDGIAGSQTAEGISTVLSTLYEKLASVETPQSTCPENILNILSHARRPVTRVKGMTFQNATYRKLSLDQITYQNIAFVQLRFIKSTATNISFNKSEIKKLNCEQSSIDNVVLVASTIRHVRIWHSGINTLRLEDSNIVFETWRNGAIRQGQFTSSIIVGQSETVGASWLASRLKAENSIFVNLDFGNTFEENLEFVNCTFVMCRVKDPTAFKGRDCRGVMIGPSNFEDKQGGLVTWTAPHISRIGSSGRKEERSWHELLVGMFPIGNLPLGLQDIRNRLRQVDTAFAIQSHKGNILKVVGSSFCDDGQECRVIACSLQETTFLDLAKKAKFNELNRRLELSEESKEVVARVRRGQGQAQIAR